MPTTSAHYRNELERDLARDFDRVRGRLMALVESMGLEDEQTAGAKSLIKTLTYQSQRELYETLRADQRPVRRAS